MGERIKYSLCRVTLGKSSSRLKVFKDMLLQETSADEDWEEAGGGFSVHGVQAALSRVSSLYHVDEMTTEVLWEEPEVQNFLLSWIPHFLIDKAIATGLIGHFSHVHRYTGIAIL